MNLPIIIEDSPIEFVLTGPFAGSDQVIVKSMNAKLDLVGAVTSASAREFPDRRNGILDTLFYSDKRKISVTEGAVYEDILQYEDARPSNYYFAWSGQARSGTQEYVSALIRTRIHEIVKAIRQQNNGNLEWSLSALVHAIAQDDEHYKNRRRTFRLIIGMYIALGAVAVTVHFADKYLV